MKGGDIRASSALNSDFLGKEKTGGTGRFARLQKQFAETEIIKIAETARHTLQKKYNSIVQEEWKRKYTILESVIGERSKQLERADRFIDNFFIDRYTSFPATTVEERETLSHLGIEISICQEIGQ